MDESSKAEPDEAIGFGETLRRIKSDYLRICEMMGGDGSLAKRIFWVASPNVVALALFRISHYFHVKHLRFIAWPIYLVNLYLTGADIPPSSEIGPRCFLGHVRGTIICGKIGANALLFASPGIGGGMGNPGEDRPANGLPVLGDNVMVGARAMVLGPVYIGDGATVGAGTLVTRDLPAGATTVQRPPQVLRTAERSIDYDAIAAKQ